MALTPLNKETMNWIVAANPNVCNHRKIFTDHSTASWSQANNKFKVGDIVYLYCSSPISAIQYRCEVTAINLNFEEIRDDRGYWNDPEDFLKAMGGKYISLQLLERAYTNRLGLDKLKSKGLKFAPQGRVKVNDPELSAYLEEEFASASKKA